MNCDPKDFIYGIPREYNLDLDEDEWVRLGMVLEDWLKDSDKKDSTSFDKEQREVVERIWQRLDNQVSHSTHEKN